MFTKTKNKIVDIFIHIKILFIKCHLCNSNILIENNNKYKLIKNKKYIKNVIINYNINEIITTSYIEKITNEKKIYLKFVELKTNKIYKVLIDIESNSYIDYNNKKHFIDFGIITFESMIKIANLNPKSNSNLNSNSKSNLNSKSNSNLNLSLNSGTFI